LDSPAESLAKNSKNEQQVADQITPPQPTWLLNKTVDPFQPGGAHRTRSPANSPSYEIEQRADSKGKPTTSCFQVIREPKFLSGISHPDENNIGIRRFDHI
jgi:hypothetical protein